MTEERQSGDDGHPDFATALRQAITVRGVTLAWLQHRLAARGNAVSMATLSYWRSGARRPEGAQSYAAVEDIESLLGLEPGTLLTLIGPSHRLGPLGTPAFPLSVQDMQRAVQDVFLGLGAPMPESSRDVSTHAVTDVGADGYTVSRTTRSLIQATAGTVTEVPYLELTPGIATPAPDFVALGGGTVVRRYSHPSGEAHGALFRLERPVESAQTTVLEWQLRFPPGYPGSRETGHGVSRRCRDILLWTRFHPDALPDWLEEIEEAPTGRTSTRLSLDGGTSIHQVRRRFGPGLLVLRWGYGARE